MGQKMNDWYLVLQKIVLARQSGSARVAISVNGLAFIAMILWVRFYLAVPESVILGLLVCIISVAFS